MSFFSVHDYQARWLAFFACVGLFAFSTIALAYGDESHARISGPNSVPSHRFVLGGTSGDLHVLLIETADERTPDYRYEFRSEGVAFMVDRKAGLGWESLASHISPVPESLVAATWEPYLLSLSTAGSYVRSGWDLRSDHDGVVSVVRTFDAYENGELQVFTETWTIPSDIEALLRKGPKVMFEMTGNEARPRPWRLRWTFFGIASITKNNLDIRDEDGWPIRRQEYDSFAVDVNDFDNSSVAADGNSHHRFSEYASGGRAEVLFFPEGTLAARVIDPTVVTLGVSSAWNIRTRGVFYDGERFFAFYRIAPNIYYKSSVDNVTWTATSTLITDVNTTDIDFYISQVQDKKFDLVYENSSTDTVVVTAKIDGTNISTSTASASPNVTNCDSVATGRTPSADRIFVVCRNVAELEVWSANQTGDANLVTSWTGEITTQESNVAGYMSTIPYGGSDGVLVMYQRDPGGTASDEVYSRSITRSGGAGTQVALTDLNALWEMGTLFRVSDTEIHYFSMEYFSGANDYTWNGTSWSTPNSIPTAASVATTIAGFYDKLNRDFYASYITIGTTPDRVQQSKMVFGTTTWSLIGIVDDNESGDSVSSISQMAEPASATSTTLREQFLYPWAYRATNGAVTDIKVGVRALAGTTTQRAFNFLNDNGATVNAYTTRSGLATSTIATGVRKGERTIIRFQVDNRTSATSTKMYRLQWENTTDAPGTWNDLGTTTQIRWSHSEKGAPTARWGLASLPTNQNGMCTSGTTYTPGRFVAGGATSTPISLPPNGCTEIAFAIETSGATLGKTYRYRLVNGLTGLPFDATILGGAYATYASSTIESTQSIRYSKEARGGISEGAIGTNAARTNAAIGPDGYPVLTYNDTSAGTLKYIKCNDVACSSYIDKTLISSASDNSLAIGTDGNPVIAYYNTTSADLYVLKCADISCSSTTTSAVDTSANDVGQSPSIAIGTDGYPVISYYDATDKDLEFAKCSNTSCSSSVLRTLDTFGDTTTLSGDWGVLAIGSDGYPVIVVQKWNTPLSFMKCTDAACSTTSTTTTAIDTQAGFAPSIAIGSDGYPIMAYYIPGNDLRVTKCNTMSCSSQTSTTISTVNINDPLIAIGTDGLPRIHSRRTLPYETYIDTCNDLSCTSASRTMVKSSGSTYGHLEDRAFTLGADGYPILFVQSNVFLRCSSSNCAPAASSTANLVGSSTDLLYFLDDAGYVNVASSDNVYDSITAATGTRLAYLFKKTNTNNTDQIDVSWEGQLSIATTTYLKIYNYSSGAWETLASNTPTPGTDFTLSGIQSSNLSNYYDGSKTVSIRLETGTTTKVTTLQSDRVAITLSAPSAAPTIVHYRWREDNGTESAATYSDAEDTALDLAHSVYIGDRKRVRMTVTNSGGVPASNITYRLEYASSSCSSWISVPSFGTQTTEEWVTDLSQWLPDGAVTTHSSGMTVPPGKSFVAGQAKLASNQTGAHTISPTEYTELEYALRSTSYAQANLLYCFRVTNAGVATGFSYSVRPEITLTGNARPQVGGGGSEGNGQGNQQQGGGQGGGQGAGGEGSGTGGQQTGGGAGGGGGDSG